MQPCLCEPSCCPSEFGCCRPVTESRAAPLSEIVHAVSRGFKVCKHGTLHLEYDKPGTYTEHGQQSTETKEPGQEQSQPELTISTS